MVALIDVRMVRTLGVSLECEKQQGSDRDKSLESAYVRHGKDVCSRWNGRIAGARDTLALREQISERTRQMRRKGLRRILTSDRGGRSEPGRVVKIDGLACSQRSLFLAPTLPVVWPEGADLARRSAVKGDKKQGNSVVAP